MAELNWTLEAKSWLRDIYDYIEYKDVASDVIQGIVSRAELLEEHPEAGQRLWQYPKENIRMILYGKYRIVYRIVNSERIDILGVYHGSLDLERHLKL